MKHTFTLFTILLSLTTAYCHKSTLNEHLFFAEKLILIDTFKDAEDKKMSRKARSSKFSAKKSRGDDLYYDLGYLSAADYYLELHEKGKLDENGMLKLAESYRLNSRSHDAEYWYAQAITLDSDATDILHYAQMLQRNEKCEDALRWFKHYIENTDGDRQVILEDCDQINHLPRRKGVKIINQESINSSDSDFSPVRYRDGLVFTTTRGFLRPTKNTDKWTKENFTDLFYAEEFSSGKFNDATPFATVNGRFHDGSASFDDKGEYMVFSRNSLKERDEEGVKSLKIYSASYKDNHWSDAHLVEINDNSSSTHPCLSADGQRMYFASDRPGGYGGMDIYVAVRLRDQWVDPVNLGPVVNTAGNEVFPFIDIEDNLYYASDGHLGYGGLDIHKAQKSVEYDEKSWDIRENIGAPINTKYDDFAFTLFAEGNSGYLSSNRVGGKGEDDIYRWEAEDGLLSDKSSKKRSICVRDVVSQQKLAGMQVKVFKNGDTNGEITITLKPTGNESDEYLLNLKDRQSLQGKDYTTNKSGEFSLKIDEDAIYTFEITGNGYKREEYIVQGSEILLNKEYCLSVEAEICITIAGLVNNLTYSRPVANAEVELFNKCTGEVTTTQTDKNGEFNFCVECDCDYELKANKDYFAGEVVVVTTKNMSCTEPGLVNTEIDLNLLDKDAWDEKQRQLSISRDPFSDENAKSGKYQYPQDFLMEYLTGAADTPLQVGQVFTLRNVYYDFSEFAIRLDAENELDYIASLMEQNAAMKISLAAHTDARGTDEYNIWLSRKRVDSAYDYLISRGISPNRIVSNVGYGEKFPVNDCTDFRRCNEAEYQLNRRTEVKVVGM